VKQLKVGQAVELEVDGTRPRLKLPALVQSSELGECVLSLPMTDCPPEPLVPDAPVTLRFGTSMGHHEVRSSVVEVIPGKRVDVVLGAFHSERTAQRRSHFRTSANLAVELSVLASKTAKLGEQDRRAISLDISGGGMRVETALTVALEDRLGVVVRVPQKLHTALPPVLICEARVVRIEPIIRRGLDLFRVALQFSIRREPERDPFVRLTMDLERGLDRPDDE
jgi:hypothetical protein